VTERTSQVSRLFLATTRRRPVREVEDATAVADQGLEGCRHGRPSNRRQVLLVEGETLDSLGLSPGQVKENITTRGVRLNELAEGQRLTVGQSVFEVTGPCEPCSQMDEIRKGLQEELRGRRGILCRVVEGGRIRRGDTIKVMRAAVGAQKAGGER
jgi:MOSC domain-containing protein YiiM